MRATRFVLAAAGALLLGWGIWLMLSRQDLDQLASAALWLIAVVVVHDGLVAAIGAVRHRRRRGRGRGRPRGRSHRAGEANEGSI
ncbi:MULTISPECIES: hypothetical protein [unclassified Microbacterium]|uniref:hypothetical protein n=1 Tax=unclassified Microbacterium TaxID=2609290 RepID=UPI000EA8E11A|nr:MULTISPECIES: hypothetical protein [unclassified Microbacterium]MBT2483752.1 hypothetical protein [Microbacterium sp. ISL-108]RKN66743.1 hypothetical protein D7252_03465 [Microbacterium sp. CGR2]